MAVVVALLFTALWMAVGYGLIFELATRRLSNVRMARAAAAFCSAVAVFCAYVPHSLRFEPQRDRASASPEQKLASACHDKRTAGRVEMGYIDFSQVLTPAGKVTQSFIAGDTFVLRGWAAASYGKVPANQICLLVDGTVSALGEARLGLLRQDVATALHVPSLENSGYEVRVTDLRVSDFGKHRVGIGVVEPADGTVAPLSTSIELDTARGSTSR